MSAKQLLFCLCLLPTNFLQMAIADNNWTGYRNDKSLAGEVYGYLSVTDSATADTKLRLLCHAGVFTLLFDDRLVASSNTVAVAIDRLPEQVFIIDRFDTGVGISNNTEEFWALVAQMVAGANMRIDTGDGGIYQYALSGFTKSYLAGCGWSEVAQMYRKYLHHYR